MKKVFVMVLLLSIIAAWVLPASAQQKGEGRYQIFFPPDKGGAAGAEKGKDKEENVFLLDTRDGRVWQFSRDRQLGGLRFWRAMPVEGLDYPLSTYKKKAKEFFFRNKRLK